LRRSSGRGVNPTPDFGYRQPASSTWSGSKWCRNASRYPASTSTPSLPRPDAAGLLYLTVGVARRANGSLALAGYPAFVGAPATGPAQPPARVRGVGDPALATVVERALRNYLAASPGELAADLTRGARVSLPDLTLTLQSVAHLNWSPDGHSVVAVVQADDGRGVQYTLAYEVDVSVAEGRWEVSAVQMDPGM
jgi:hypothetical protein